jgi:hypothetical protein
VTTLHNLDAGVLALMIPLLGIVVGGLIAATALLSSAWRKVRQAEFDASLKSQMLEQGKSVEEIERVLAAGKHHRRDDRC